MPPKFSINPNISKAETILSDFYLNENIFEESKEKIAKSPDDKSKVAPGDKEKSAKLSDGKAKTAPEDKGKFANKETKKK